MSREAVQLSLKLLNDKLELGFPDNLVIAGFKAAELPLSSLRQTLFFHLHDIVLLLIQKELLLSFR